MEVSVYPNPASVHQLSIRISTNANDPVSIRLVDMVGHVVFEKNLYPGTIETTFPLNVDGNVTDGVYILFVNNSKHEVKKRIVLRSNQ